MRALYSIPLLLSFFVLFSCGEPKAEEGQIVYAVEYPEAKDNFVLYGILPREMELTFKGGKMKTEIKRANFQNSLLVDCNKKKVSAYYQYSREGFNVNLSDADVKKMQADPSVYKIEFKDDEKDILGLKALKAIATNKSNPKDVIEIWYTEDIALENSNWFHPFHEVPGVLLEYAIDRYGIRMEFKATAFNKKKIADGDLKLPLSRNEKNYDVYNQKLNDLFKPFE